MEPVLDDSDDDSDLDRTSPQNNIEHNQMSLDCILWSKTEADAVQEYLDDIDMEYVKTDPEGDCFYDSILASLNTPINTHTGVKYSGNDLRLQICFYMLSNPKICSKILHDRLEGFGTSLYHFTVKMMREREWGEACLLKIIYNMWGTNCTILDVTHNEQMFHFGSKKHKSLRTADIVLIYNGSNHYSGAKKKSKGIYIFFRLLFASFAFCLECKW